MKIFIIFLLAIISSNVWSSCSNFDYRKIDHNFKSIYLENEEFCIIYSLDKKIPLLVYSKFVKHNAMKRDDSFNEDERIEKEYRSRASDFYKSGYDRGHLFPAADASTNISMAQTFLLSNIAPQNPKFNRVSWRLLEDKIRDSTNVKYVYTGTIVGDFSIGNGVNVPSYFYKVIILKDCYHGYIGSNKDGVIKRITLKDLYRLNNMNFNIKLKECSDEF